jgi:hypothetical protein
MVQEPLIDHQQGERGVLPEELRLSLGFVAGQCPGFLEVGHADVVGADPVLAGLFGQRASQV